MSLSEPVPRLSTELVDWIRTTPKTELHVHIEGAIRPETVLHLAKKNRVENIPTSVEALREWFTFRDFPHFVEVYIGVTRCIKNPEDIECVTREFLQGQAEQNIVRTEATFTASTLESHCHIPIDEQMDAMSRALAWGKTQLGIECSLVLDIVRGQSQAKANETVEWTAKYLGKGVCALGIAGFEAAGTKQYAEAFEEAKRLSLPITAHAGETEPAWSIWETLEVTGTKRIGHGITAIDDPKLIEHLIENQIVLEVCPSSNVCLGVSASIEEHPIQSLRQQGVKVTLNSDDPPMFGTTLTDELLRCALAFGWEQADLEQMQQTASDAAFPL